MPTVEIWIAMSEDGDCEVATDEDTAIERLIDGSSDDLQQHLASSSLTSPCLCRAYLMTTNRIRPAVDVAVAVPDGAGRMVEAT